MADSDAENLANKYRLPVPSGLDPKKDPILVIEGQMDLRLIVVHQLQKLNFNVIQHTTNGYDAIELMKEAEKPFRAIICDMEAPLMGGLDLLAELREKTELDRPPFCLTMNNVSKEKLMLAVENGVDEVLVKPFTLNDIGPKIHAGFKKYHNPSNPERVYELAKLCLRQEKLDAAEKIYTDLAAHAPGTARPLVGLARIAAKRQDYNGALSQLGEAEKQNPNFVHTFHERGTVFAAMSRWDEAIDAFHKAIELSPLNPMRYKDAADLLFKVKRYQDAADLLETALKHELRFPDLQHYLSQAKFALKDYKAAAKHIRSALSTDENNVNYLNQLGICLKELEQYDEATKVYNQVIKLDQANAPALYNKAILLNQKGYVDDAIKLLERLAEKHPAFEAGKAKLDEFRKARDAA